jgi:hypothetical protein
MQAESFGSADFEGAVEVLAAGVAGSLVSLDELFSDAISLCANDKYSSRYLYWLYFIK